MRNWQLEYEHLFKQNESLVKEIRHLRCVMVEAAGSINPSIEPVLFSQLTGAGQFFVDDRCNPYPEHDEHVSDQCMAALTTIADVNTIRSAEYSGAGEFLLPLPQPRGYEDGEL